MSAGGKGVDVLAVLDHDRRVLLIANDASPIPLCIMEHDEARAAIAELIAASRRVTNAFRAMSSANGLIACGEARIECEQSMLALDAAIAALAKDGEL